MKGRCSCSAMRFVAKLLAEGSSANSFAAVLRNIGLPLQKKFNLYLSQQL
jgi:hypothetical protein